MRPLICMFCRSENIHSTEPTETNQAAFRCLDCNVRVSTTNFSYLPSDVQATYRVRHGHHAVANVADASPEPTAYPAFRRILSDLTDSGKWPTTEREQREKLSAAERRIQLWKAMLFTPERIAERELTSDRIHAHRDRRLRATQQKLTNTRRALRDFMKAQIATLNELKAELTNKP